MNRSAHVIKYSKFGENREKVHSSIFFMTINSNKADVETYEAKLVEAYDLLVANIEHFLVVLKGEREEGLKKIDKFDNEAQIEVGDIFHRAHLHAILRFSHRTFIQINKAAVEELFDRMIGSKTYVNIQAARDSLLTLQNYINKKRPAQNTVAKVNKTR